ncbi:MAG: O-acetyl-ADP-ribose deacetylase [Nitrosarchaeum sp.]|nr:O-acetyl-ADP-ribose deacetylase [Nitrosarchaeum sp.]
MHIDIIRGDITTITADAIVNAANTSLMGGGGVDGAIHEAAGPALLEACKTLRREEYPQGLPVGKAAATPAYKLPARIIIHTVAPRNGVDDLSLLSKCYLNALRIADSKHCTSIAFPALGTGAFGIPISFSAKAIKRVLTVYKPLTLKRIILVLATMGDYSIYKHTLEAPDPQETRT